MNIMKLLIPLSLICGTILRLIFVQDMEYKEDEELNFYYSQTIGSSLPWPWIGMPSGVYIPNPGMSYWIFALLAKVAHATTPTELATALQVFSILGLCLLLPFAYKLVKEHEEKQVWLWAFTLTMVNPIFVYYQRKLWPEPFLPFFTILTLMGWWKKQNFFGALTWGIVGAILGQIHMSGFFLALALFLWTLFFDTTLRWQKWIKGWLLGSTLGAMPLIPWLFHIITRPPAERVFSGFSEPIQLKFWSFWMSNPFGLHLGNPLGLLLGNSHFEQLSDFIRYPLFNGHSSYINAFVHLLVLALLIWILLHALNRFIFKKYWKIFPFWTGQATKTDFLSQCGFLGFGTLLTLSFVNIRRYYVLVGTPLEAVWMIRSIQKTFLKPVPILLALWICQISISSIFVYYIHVNQGSLKGDYGQAYYLIPTRQGLSGRYPSVPKSFQLDTPASSSSNSSNP